MCNFKKEYPVRRKMFHVDGRMDMTKLWVTLCNSCDSTKNKYKFVNKMTTNHTYHSQLTQCPLYQIYLKTTISNIILVQSCTIHININLNSRPGMQQVYENNHTLVPYHEQFCYTHKPDISSLSTKILLTVKQNEVQQTLMSMFQLSLLFALTLNAKYKKHLSICSSL